jgi:hypothetical protein
MDRERTLSIRNQLDEIKSSLSLLPSPQCAEDIQWINEEVDELKQDLDSARNNHQYGIIESSIGWLKETVVKLVSSTAENSPC